MLQNIVVFLTAISIRNGLLSSDTEEQHVEPDLLSRRKDRLYEVRKCFL